MLGETNLEMRAASESLAFGDGVRLALMLRDEHGNRAAIAKPATLVKYDPLAGAPTNPEFACISRDAARRLMDDLWHIGIRPTEFRHSDAAAAACAAHLEDMRAIAFAKLELNKP